MMNRIYLNDDWFFSAEWNTELTDKSTKEDELEKVRLPHTVKELPFHYFHEKEYQMICGYRRHLYVPKEWKDKVLLLTVDGACHGAELFVNGTKVLFHGCGYTAFSVDIAPYVRVGEDNILAVKLDSNENQNIPPFGYVIDYMTFGGLTREVFLEVKEKMFLEDVFVFTEVSDIQNLSAFGKIKGRVKIQGAEGTLALRQSIKDEKGILLTQEWEVKEAEFSFESERRKIELWDVDRPKLYTLETVLLKDGRELDVKEVRFGYREAIFKKDGFYLNGRKLKIRGLNRHQSYPYVGYAMPESMQRYDADILKKELGCNAVRTSHYPQSHYFIDQCDELGLLVFMEFPGWQHIGDEEWKKQALINEREMITQYRNHASIIIWGIRINESKDDEDFYRRTNELARSLDESRPTGGVRAHKKSQFFEDVYTYNDFVHSGKNEGCEPKKKVVTDMEKAYLITEYNGHMFPTKAFDSEEHRVEHALRHANVLNAVAGEEDISGSFGWCMFDYNTHKDFGSGDRICYHGVMDMFRNPKLASVIYACQQEEVPVLELSSSMDIGEHPACNRGYTYILSNADSVKMYKNDIFIKEYHSTDSPYKNLLHGPIVIDDFIGDEILKNEKDFSKKQAQIIKDGLNYTALHGYGSYPLKVILGMLRCIIVDHMKMTDSVALYNKYIGDWGGTSTVYRFEAIKDGKVVKTIVKEPMKNMHFDVTLSDTVLEEKNSYDVLALRIRALDDNGNQMFFFQDPVTIETEGPVEVIGPKVTCFRGGMTGTYIKSVGKTGEAKITLSNPQLGTKTISINVKGDK